MGEMSVGESQLKECIREVKYQGEINGKSVCVNDNGKVKGGRNKKVTNRRKKEEKENVTFLILQVSGVEVLHKTRSSKKCKDLRFSFHSHSLPPYILGSPSTIPLALILDLSRYQCDYINDGSISRSLSQFKDRQTLSIPRNMFQSSADSIYRSTLSCFLPWETEWCISVSKNLSLWR